MSEEGRVTKVAKLKGRRVARERESEIRKMYFIHAELSEDYLVMV